MTDAKQINAESFRGSLNIFRFLADQELMPNILEMLPLVKAFKS